MKNILFICLLLGAPLLGQAELVVGVTVEERSMQMSSDLKDMLYNRVQRGLANAGIGANQMATLSVLASVDEGEMSVTATQPIRYLRKYFVELQLANKGSGEVFATYTEEITVAKRSEREAKRGAVLGIELRGSKFAAFVDRSKQEIKAYYRTNCSAVLAQAERAFANDQFLFSIQMLLAIPTSIADCSIQVTERIQEAYQAYETLSCDRRLAYAEALIANSNFDEAVLQLLTIPDPGRCRERYTAISLQLRSEKRDIRREYLDRLVIMEHLEITRDERQRRFLENMALIHTSSCCRGVDRQGRVIIVE